MDIENWRTRIDELESVIVELLNKRAEYATEIGKIKKAKGLPILDAAREREILLRVGKKSEALRGPLSAEAMQHIFSVIMQETRRVEK